MNAWFSITYKITERKTIPNEWAQTQYEKQPWCQKITFISRPIGPEALAEFRDQRHFMFTCGP